MRRLSSNSRKNQIYKAFREVGRVMRTVADEVDFGGEQPAAA